ncbi:hypothetical protein ACROYT_G000455 [Oculina patagonica]
MLGMAAKFSRTVHKSYGFHCIMGFSGLLRRNSSRRRSFKRIEPRDRASQSTNAGAQHRSADADAANREKRTSREIGTMLRKIGDELNNSRLKRRAPLRVFRSFTLQSELRRGKVPQCYFSLSLLVSLLSEDKETEHVS